MKQNINRYGIFFISCIAMLCFGGGCADNFSGLRYDSNDKMQIYDYVSTRPDLSIYKELLDYTQFNGPMSIAGTYTAFVPNDNAFQELFKQLTATGENVSRIQDKPAEYWLPYLRYQTIEYSKINTNTLENGKINYPTMMGDDYFIVADIRESYKAIKLNSTSTIIEYNIDVANGYIDIIDKVLLPPSKSVYEMLDESGKFTKMLDVFEKTGLTGYLKDSVVTVMVEPDAVLERDGFNPDTVSDLHSWAAYHILYNQRMFSSDLAERTIYSLYPDQSLVFSVDKEGKMWCNKVFGFSQDIVYGIDKVAENGIFHVLDTTAHIVEALPGIRRHNLYGKTQTKEDGTIKYEQNVFTEAPSMIYEDLSASSYHQEDQMPPICGFDATTVGDYFYLTIPDVVKGKFQVRMIYKAANARANLMMIYNDNIISRNITMTSGTNWPDFTSLQYKDMGVITIEKRGPVKLLFQVTKLNTSSSGDMLMDMIELRPVEE